RADSIGRDDRHVIALDRGFGGEVGRIPVGNRLDAIARRRAILGDEIAQARLHGAETLRGRLIADIALYIGTDRHDQSWRHSATSGEWTITVIRCWRSCSAGPMPECMRIFGL